MWHSHEIFFSVCPKNCSVKNYLNSGLDYPELIDLYHFQNDFHGKKKKILDIFLCQSKKLQCSTKVFELEFSLIWIVVQTRTNWIVQFQNEFHGKKSSSWKAFYWKTTFLFFCVYEMYVSLRISPLTKTKPYKSLNSRRKTLFVKCMYVGFKKSTISSWNLE